MRITQGMVARTRDVRCAAIQQARLAPLAATRKVAARHTDHCLVCQAEEVRERTLTRLLSTLRDAEEPAPPGFADRVTATLDAPIPAAAARARTATRNRLVVAASASALAVGVAVAASRRLRAALI